MPTVIPVVESLDAIDEGLRELYEEKDGKFVLTKPVSFDDARELKEALKKERQAAADARAALRRLEQERQAQGAGITAEQLTKLRQEIEAEYAPTREELAKAQQALRELRLDRAVQEMLAKAGVLPHRVQTLYRLIADQLDLSDAGEPVHRKGKALSTWIGSELKAEYPEFFASQQRGGTPAPHQSTAGGAADDTRGPQERLAAFYAGAMR
jgi:hypothetical protein